MHKKILYMTIGFIMSVAIFSGCGIKKNKADDVIKVGAVFPLSGDTDSYGQSSKEALELLVDESNKAGGITGKKIKIIYEDDENKPENAVKALKKLIKNDKIAAVIGTTSSDGSIAMAVVASENKIPMITATATSPKITQAGDYVFRASFSDSFQGTVLAKFAAEDLKAKSAAVLYNIENEYSKGLAEFFRAGIEKAGGKVSIMETYNNNDKDFNVQLRSIKAKNPDVILIPDYYNVVGLIAKQARAQGITCTLLGGDGWDSPDLYKAGGTALNGSYFSSHYSPENNTPESSKFKSDYKSKYDKEPDAYAALAYDAGKILLNSISKVGSTSSTKIRDAIKQTDMDAVSGSIKFDANRETIKPAVIMNIQNQRSVLVKILNP